MRFIGLAVVLMAPASSAWSWDDTRQILAPPPSCAAGARCSISTSPGFMKGQVSAAFAGKSVVMAGRTANLRITDARGTVVRERSPLVGSDGSLNFPLADGQAMAPGRYRYTVEGFGSGSFDVMSGQTASSTAESPAAPPGASQSGPLAGVWHGIANTPGSLELAADGSYRLNGKPGERYRQTGDSVLFDGALQSWNGGRAKLREGVLEFQWTNEQGFRNWFVFSR